MRAIFFLATFIFSIFFMQKALALTPNISANALFLYRNSNQAKTNTSTTRNGVDIQEAELAVYSDVDPYSRLNMIVTLHPEYTANTTGVDQKWKVEPEELYADLTQIPSANMRLGKFKAAFGKHNQMHSHAFFFVDSPLPNAAMLTEDGFNDVGASAAVLLPVHWFSEVTAQAFRGEGDNLEFNSPTPNDFVALGHWKNLLDISEAATFELGLSGMKGKNSIGGDTNVIGTDLTFKWRPVSGGKYHSWLLSSEIMRRRLQQPSIKTERSSGFYVMGQYQFAERWASLLRYETLSVSNADSSVNTNALLNGDSRRYAAGIHFDATEFSSYKAEYSYKQSPPLTSANKFERKFYVQANFTIGAHPAHSY